MIKANFNFLYLNNFDLKSIYLDIRTHASNNEKLNTSKCIYVCIRLKEIFFTSQIPIKLITIYYVIDFLI